MNPWWKRPSPGTDGTRKKRQVKRGAAKTPSDADDQPSRLGDTLQNADDISELDGDLFDDDEKPTKKRKRRRKKSGGKSKKKSPGIGLVLCDLEAFAHTLNSETIDPEPMLDGLWRKAPGKLRAYSGGRGHARLAAAAEELGFDVIELEEDQIATQMTVDAWSAAEDLDDGEAVLLIADHPSLVPLCEHLKETGVTVLVHRSQDNPLAQACSLAQAKSGGRDDRETASHRDGTRGRRGAPRAAERRGGSEQKDELGSDSEDLGEDDETQGSSSARRSARRPPKGGTSRRTRGSNADDSDDFSEDSAFDDAQDSDKEDSASAKRTRRGGRERAARSSREESESKRGGRESTAGSSPRVKQRSQHDPLQVLDAAMGELSAGEPRVMWATLIRQECHRQAPGFDETHHGFDSFQELLEEAQRRGLLELKKHEKTDSYLVTSWTPVA